MKNRENGRIWEPLKRILLLGLSLGLLAVLAVLFLYIWREYYNNTIVKPFFRRGNWMMAAIYMILFYSFAQIYGGFKIGSLKRGNVFYSLSLSVLFVNSITYLQTCLLGRGFVRFWPFIYLTLADLGVCFGWVIFTSHIYRKFYPPRQMLMVYGSDMASSLEQKLSFYREKYRVCEAVSVNMGREELENKIREYDSIIICDVKSETRNQLLKFCFAHSVRVYVTPKIADVILRGADTVDLFDVPLLLCRNRGLTFGQRFLKRGMDLLLSGAALISLSPFMAVTALAVKLCDGGPVFYKQKRLTEGGRVFEVYKFRSMRVDAEKETGAVLAGKEDNRVTPVGKIIRAIRFDELPQLLNILKGDMSIVGPRPERPELAEQYQKTMPEFAFRLKVKAGLTGYAQVMGRYNTRPYDKLKFDLMYIGQYSLLLDIKLMLMTVKILFLKESTEGVDRGAEKK